MARREYQRLTRARNRRWFALALVSRVSLWLGADHLLVVESNGFTETYKRFYFRDIQGFLVQKTSRYAAFGWILGVCFTLSLALVLIEQYPGRRIVFGVVAGLFGLLLLIHLVRGQTCRSYIWSAVQMEQLPPLRRIRQAEKIFDRLRPLIAEAQGGALSAETAMEMARREAQDTLGQPAASPSPPFI